MGREVQNMKIEVAEISDSREILELQKTAYISEARIYNDFTIPPLIQTREELEMEFSSSTFYILRPDDKIIGSVNLKIKDNTGYIGRLIVLPREQGKGLGKQLLRHCETSNPGIYQFELFTGHKSERNLKFYRGQGYREFRRESINEKLDLIYMCKNISR